jgi:uncharacterized membrane protein
MDRLLDVLNLLAAVGCGLIAGVFFAFSTFVMRALNRLPPRERVAATQAINVVVINPMFLGVFLGSVVMCAAAGAGAVVRWERPAAAYVLAGAVLYVVGTFLVTIACNVPLNNQLAAVTADDPMAADLWRRYVRHWTTWNHVRTAMAAAAMVMFIRAITPG